MSETNLTQRSTSTYVLCVRNFFSEEYEENFQKRGDLLRMASYYSNSNCVRKLINIVMTSVRTAQLQRR